MIKVPSKPTLKTKPSYLSTSYYKEATNSHYKGSTNQIIIDPFYNNYYKLKHYSKVTVTKNCPLYKPGSKLALTSRVAPILKIP